MTMNRSNLSLSTDTTRAAAGLRDHLRSSTAAAGLLRLAVATGFVLVAVPAALANPQGGTVTAGKATIDQKSSTVTQITQTTDRAVIDWRSFSIDQGQTTIFQQPSSSSTTLNRVTGPDPSVIAGKLQANGNLILINQSGIVFSQGSQVDVNGIVATPSDISNKNFMAGNLTFDTASPKPGAKVVNEGTITVAEKGLAALVAPGTSNSGVINAKLGRVVIGGAETFTVDFNGDGLISFDVTSKVKAAQLGADGKASPLVSNTGKINAQGGRVLLTAEAADGILTDVVSMGGEVSAKAQGAVTGSVVVDAGATGKVSQTGKIDVSGLGAGEKGGLAVVTGKSVALADGATIDARGDAGGGTIKVGGGYQGKDTSVRNAKITYVAGGALLDASATTRGKGGTVTIWSDEATGFYGKIAATGGRLGGDGGFAEVSSKGYLAFSGAADLTAANGATGSLLLDPGNITIGGVTLGPDLFSGQVLDAKVDSGVPVATLQTQFLNANVSILAADTVTFTSSIDLTPTPGAVGDRTFTITAGKFIVNNGVAITSTNRKVNWSVTTNSNTGGLDINGSIDTNGGNFNATVNITGTGGIVNIGGPLKTGAGSVSVSLKGESLAVGGNTNATYAIDATEFKNITAASASFASDKGLAIGTKGQAALAATGALSFQATGGNILVDNSVTASTTLSLTSATNVTVNSANTLEATTGALTIATTTDLVLGDVASATATKLKAGTTVDLTGVTGTITGKTGAAITIDAGTGFTVPKDITTAGTTIIDAHAGNFDANGKALNTTNNDITINAANIGLSGTSSITGKVVALNATGTIGDGGGTGLVTATTLTGTSTGGTSLTNANNAIGTIDGFTNTGAGGVTIVAKGDLRTNGSIDAGTGALKLTTGATKNLKLGNDGGSTTLIAGTQVDLSGIAGTITGGTGAAVTIDAGSGFTLPKDIKTSGTTTIKAHGGNFDGGSKALDAGTNDLAINAANIVLSGTSTVTGKAVALNATGTIGDGGGTGLVTATTLTGTSTGGTSLTNANNAIGTVDGFTNTGAGGVTIVAKGDLRTNGSIDAGTGALKLTTAVGKNLTLGNDGGSTTLTAGTQVDLSGIAGTIIGGTGAAVTIDAGSGFTLPKDITTSGKTTINAHAADFSAGGKALNAGTSDITINATKIDLSGTITGNVVAVNATGTVGDGAGAGLVKVTTLKGTSTGGTSLTNNNNAIGTIDGFTNTGAGGITIQAKSDLRTNGSIDAGTGALTLITGAGKNLTLGNDGGSTTLTAGTKVDLTGITGAITGGAGAAVTIDAGSGFTLPNDIKTSGKTVINAHAADFSAGGKALDAGTGDITINAAKIGLSGKITGNVVAFNATSTVGDGGGVGTVNASTLKGTSTGGTSLTNVGNAIGKIDGFTNTGAGGITIVTKSDLRTNGSIDAGTGALKLTTAAGKNLTLGNDGGSTTLTAGTQVDLAGVAGTITGGSGAAVTIDAGSGFTLPKDIKTSGTTIINAHAANFDANGKALDAGTDDITINAASIALSGAITGNVLALNATGKVDDGAGAGTVKASTLTGKSTGGTSLTNANNEIGAIAGFTNSGTGGIAVTSATGLSTSGTIDAGTDALALKTTTGGMTLAGALFAGTSVDLTSAGSISGDGVVITAAKLTGSSNGGATLGGANKIVSLEGFTNAGSGGLSLTNAQALATAGTIDGGPGVLALKTTVGGMTLAGALKGGTAIDLVSAGSIDGAGAVLTAPALTGSSVGGAVLSNTNNAIGTIDGFTNTGAGGITFATKNDLRTNGSIDVGSGALKLVTAAGKNLTLGNDGGSTTLTAGTQVDLSGIAGTIIGGTGATVTIDAGSGFTLPKDITTTGKITINAHAGDFSTGGKALTANSADITINAANIALSSTVTGNVVAFNATGTVGDGGGVGIVKATTLTGTSTGGTSLTNKTNAIGSIGSYTNSGGGGITVNNAVALSTSGTVDAGTGTLALTTITGGMTLAGALNATTSINLVSAGSIDGNGASVTTGTLTGSSSGGTSLANTNNAIGKVDGFTNAGSGGFALATKTDLRTNGSINAGTGALTLTTLSGKNLTLGNDGGSTTLTAGTQVDLSGIAGAIAGGAGAAVTIDAGSGFTLPTDIKTSGTTIINANGGNFDANGKALDAGTKNITITAANVGLSGNITGNVLALNATGTVGDGGGAGIIKATTLTGTSTGGTSLTNTNNVIGTIDGFTNTGAGGITINNATALATNGTVDAGTGTLALKTTTGGMTFTGAVNAVTSINLVSAGSIDGNGAAVSTATLTGSSNGGTSLANANNAIGTIDGFTNGGAGGITLATKIDLRTNGSIDAGTGALKLTTAAGKNLTLGNDGGSTTLTAGTQVDLTGVAGTITGGSGAAVTIDAGSGFTLPKDIKTSGTTIINAHAANFDANGKALDAGTSDVTINAASIALSGAITGNTLALNATGTVGDGGGAGIVKASTLKGTSTGGTSLTNSNNAIGTIAGFTNSGAGGITVNNATALSTTGTVDAGSGALSLKTKSGGMTLTGALTAGTLVELSSAGAISGDGVVITAATLTGGSSGGTALGGANKINTIAGFTNSGTGGVSVNNTQALATSGTIDAGTGTLALTTTIGGMTLAGALTAGTAIDLVSAGSIDGLGAVLTAPTLTGSSSGGATFANAGNTIGTLADFINTGAGGLALTNAKALATSGTVDAGTGALALTTKVGGMSLGGALAAGTTVTLLSAGTIAGDAATITSASLGGSSSGGASFINVLNAIGSFGGFTNAGAGGISLTNGQALATSGTIDAGTGGLTLRTTAGGMTLAGGITAGSSVSLTSAGKIAGDGAQITAKTLTGSSSGGASFANASNKIGTFGGFANSGTGGITLTNAQALATSGTVDAGTDSLALTTTTGGMTLVGTLAAGKTVTLNSAGAIAGDAVAITAQGVTGSSSGGASLANAGNKIGTFRDFTNSGTGGIALVDAQALVTSGTINAGADQLTLKTTSGDLTLAGQLTAGTKVDLTSAGPIAGDGVIIKTNTLVASAIGDIALGGLNQVGTLGNVTSKNAIGATTGITFQNAGGLEIAGTVDAGSRPVAITTSGDMKLTGAQLIGSEIFLSGGGAVAISGGAFTAPERVVISTAPGTITQIGSTSFSTPILVLDTTFAAPSALRALGPIPLLSLPGIVPGGGKGDVDVAALLAPQTTLYFIVGSGAIKANGINVAQLGVSGSGGSAAIVGTVGGISGPAAAQLSVKDGPRDNNYKLNDCAIGNPTCIVLPTIAPLQPQISRDVYIVEPTRQFNDPTLQRLNFGNEDYF